MKHRLKTKRLILTPCKLKNLAEIHALWTNDEIKRFLFDNRTISVEETQSFIEVSEESFMKHNYGIWLIFQQNEVCPIGFAGLLDTDGKIPRLLYGLHPNYWRRGFAFETAHAILDYTFKRLDYPRVLSDVDEPNTASVHILKKLGMRQTKKEILNGNSLLYFEITAAEYLANRFNSHMDSTLMQLNQLEPFLCKYKKL